MPVQSFALDYCAHIRKRLGMLKIKVSIAVLAYCEPINTASNLSGTDSTLLVEEALSDTATYPAQRNQALCALGYLAQLGYSPKEMVIVGESAGGNLFLQLTSLLLRMRHSNPSSMSLREPLGGALLISPLVGMTNFGTRDCLDFATAQNLTQFANIYLDGIPQENRSEVDFTSPTASQFQGLGVIVDRMMITAGAEEVLRDDIITLGRHIAGCHPCTTQIVQGHGIHLYIHFDAMLGQNPEGKLTNQMVKWLSESLVN